MRGVRFLAWTFAALAASACSSSQPAPDASTDDVAATDDAAVDVVQVDTAPFVTAPHEPFPSVPDMGGPRMAHPKIVVITYADEANRGLIEADAQWMVTSSWLTTVGDEYGIGAGTVVGTVHLTDNAPATIDDDAIRAMVASGVADGSLPGATMGGPIESQPIYMFYFPATTTVTESYMGRVVGRSCRDFGGYHSEVQQGGYDVAYAVIDACTGFTDPYTGFHNVEGIASHELFEAASDPSQRQPAFVMNTRRPDNSWTIATQGGELGDMCVLWPNFILQDDHVVQRMWSNRAAMANVGDPCIPAPTDVPFFFTSATPTAIQIVPAGGSVDYTLQAWSTAPLPSWDVEAMAYTSDFMPTIALGSHQMNNGDTTTLTLTVPEGTPSGSVGNVLVYSARSRTAYAIVPITVLVN